MVGKGISSVISTVEESLGISTPKSLADGKEVVKKVTDSSMV